MKNNGLLINEIELGYAPMSAYHFRQIIRDKNFHEVFSDCHLYMITQRKEVTFNNFIFEDLMYIHFDIKQKGNSTIINCTLPLIQKNITDSISKEIYVRIHNRENNKKKTPFPFNGTQGFTIKKDIYTNKTLAQFTPDKLFQNYWKGHIEADFSADFRKMCEYKVHYVGKSTEQNICKRLSNHSTFQEILANERPLTYGNIPSNEIMILFFRVSDCNTLTSWGEESKPEDITNYLTNYTFPSDKTISSDAEKALIQHLQPEYNKILYSSFPKQADLINVYSQDRIFYGFTDPINLIYKKGEIRGGRSFENKDYIVVDSRTI